MTYRCDTDSQTRNATTPTARENERCGRRGDPGAKPVTLGITAIAKRNARILGGLSVAMLAGGVVRSTLPVLSKFVVEDLELSRSDFGLLLAGFTLARGVGAPVLGRVTDRIGGRNLLVVRYAGMFAGLAATAIAPGFISMLVALALTGFVTAGANPGTNRLIGYFVAPGQRGSVLGMKQAFGQVGVLLGGAILPSLALAAGWRWSIAGTLIVPILGTIILLWLVRADPPGHTSVRTEPWWSAGSTAVRQLAFAGLAMGAGVSVLFGFLPLYAQEAVGMSPASAGGLAALMAGTGFIGRIAWGLRSDRAEHVSGVLFLLSMLGIGAVALIASGAGVAGWTVWIGAALAGSSLEAWNTVANVAVVLTVSLEDSGRATGVMMTGWIAGAVVSPFVFGAIVDSTGGYTWAWVLVAALFGVSALISWRWRRSHRNEGTEPVPPSAHS